jgi:hypothetical protein
MTLSEAIRERGYDPAQLFAEMASDNKELDRLGLILDSDGRQMTQAGQLQGPASQPAPPANSAGSVERLFLEWLAPQDDERVRQVFERMFGANQ